MTAHIPVGLRVHLTHAAIQAVADGCGADLLHIKGPAVHPALRPVRDTLDEQGDPVAVPVPRLSTDADVLVRPRHVAALMAALAQHGWSTVTTFETGSAFEHAASLWHTALGWVDVHRIFPGITADPDAAFDELWRDRSEALIAHRACPVPSLTAQRLVLLLHAARGGGPLHPDVALAWPADDEAACDEVRRLATTLRAEVGLAAALGDLDAHADAPDHDLWQHFADGDASRSREWLARWKATRTPAGRLRLLGLAVRVNTDHLAMQLNRRPTRAEVARAYVARLGTFSRELRDELRRRTDRS